MGPPPEHPERLVERLEVLDPVDEQAAERVVEVGPPSDFHVRQRGGDVPRAARLHVEPQPVEHPDEVQEVVEQVGHPPVHSQRLASEGTRARVGSSPTGRRVRNGHSRPGRLRPVQHLLDTLAADGLQVFLRLEDDAERAVDGLGVQLLPVEGD